MEKIPQRVRWLLDGYSQEFSASVWPRFRRMILAAILIIGARTVWRLYRVAGGETQGHFSSFHRVFSHRRWCSFRLARRLAWALVEEFAPRGVLELVGDDTVSQHRGAKVYGKGCHRDAVRSSHTHLAHRWGHKWVVLALRVRVPGVARTWALPVLVALYRTPEESAKSGLRHRTPIQLMRGLLAVWIRWFPRRKSVFAGDGGFASHELTSFAWRHQQRLSIVSKFTANAVLHSPPPRRTKKQMGRPRVVGKRQLSPAQVVAKTKQRQRLTVHWYGGGKRLVEIVTGTGCWYRQGQGLVPIRWVYAHDLSGTHRDEYLFSSDTTMTPRQIIETFVGRWDIEVTFEEMRAHLGLEKSRGRCRQTVLRVEPCLFCLYSVIAFWFANLPAAQRKKIHVAWIGKNNLCFSDALKSVRNNIWHHQLFQHAGRNTPFDKLKPTTKNAIFNFLNLVT